MTTSEQAPAPENVSERFWQNYDAKMQELKKSLRTKYAHKIEWKDKASITAAIMMEAEEGFIFNLPRDIIEEAPKDALDHFKNAFTRDAEEMARDIVENGISALDKEVSPPSERESLE